MEIAEFLKILALMLGAAKVFGFLAQKAGQPAVLGELIAGVVVGRSVLGLVDPSAEVFRLLSELGVVFLLFAIGLETDLGALLKVGAASTAVAIAGVVVPFALGYLTCLGLGLGQVVAIVVGAAMTATSIGITARVFADLGRLRATESRIIMGAAILDDVLGLVIFTVVSGLVRGGGISALGVAKVTGIAFGFLVATIVVGRLIAADGPARREDRPARDADDLRPDARLRPRLAGWRGGPGADPGRVRRGGRAGRDATRGTRSSRGAAGLGQVFVPIFFVVVGAAVDLRAINPLDAANHGTILVAAWLTVAAVAGKFVAGYAPFWVEANKPLIGVGMMPRGEVGLIFAQMGLNSGVFDPRLFTAVATVMMLTTFLTPPLLKMRASRGAP